VSFAYRRRARVNRWHPPAPCRNNVWDCALTPLDAPHLGRRARWRPQQPATACESGRCALPLCRPRRTDHSTRANEAGKVPQWGDRMGIFIMIHPAYDDRVDLNPRNIVDLAVDFPLTCPARRRCGQLDGLTPRRRRLRTVPSGLRPSARRRHDHAGAAPTSTPAFPAACPPGSTRARCGRYIDFPAQDALDLVRHDPRVKVLAPADSSYPHPCSMIRAPRSPFRRRRSAVFVQRYPSTSASRPAAFSRSAVVAQSWSLYQRPPAPHFISHPVPSRIP